MLSKYGKCDNWITNRYCISNETEQEHMVTGNEKGNILGNCTERQIRQRAHWMVHSHKAKSVDDLCQTVSSQLSTCIDKVHQWLVLAWPSHELAVGRSAFTGTQVFFFFFCLSVVTFTCWLCWLPTEIHHVQCSRQDGPPLHWLQLAAVAYYHAGLPPVITTWHHLTPQGL